MPSSQPLLKDIATVYGVSAKRVLGTLAREAAADLADLDEEEQTTLDLEVDQWAEAENEITETVKRMNVAEAKSVLDAVRDGFPTHDFPNLSSLARFLIWATEHSEILFQRCLWKRAPFRVR